ncbi:glycoside hydrolase family 95 protein [Plantibacter sp. YIM 135347]|uniref:glycoside hydrolase family 95 protein n=1 Tax=Plantibacter sp. YIM 135347 TaxID=3423919 RepID=UPI003D340C27
MTFVPIDPDASARPADVLWYSTPAARWFEALPIGNGRLGGMVFGGADVDRIQLSESTAWSGAPSEDDVSVTAHEFLGPVRQLLFDGDYVGAHQLTEQHLLGRPTSFGTNLPLPEVRIDHRSVEGATGYRRSLDLGTAIVDSAFTRAGRMYRTETFSSRPGGVIVHRVDALDGGTVNLTVSIGEAVFPLETALDGTDLVLTGRAVEDLHSNGRDGVEICIRLRILEEAGTTGVRAGSLTVDGARAVTVLIAVGTGWDGQDARADASSAIERATELGFLGLRAEHIEDYRELYDRVSIELGPTESAVSELPTDERRDRFAAGGDDLELVALYFQFGRYLTIAGSRHDSPLPLALQGLWNDGLASSAPWTNDFHLDMNTQQNYWAAEVTGLGECQEPLLRLVERLSVSGRDTARAMYGASGWVAHTVTNAWGYSAPGWGMGWGLDVTGGAWIALQHWERWDHGRDLEFLRERAYPVLKEAAQFFLDYLVTDPNTGWLVTGPSDSPENWYLTPDGEQVAVSMGATADRVFVEAVFRMVVEAAGILAVDEHLAERISRARELLPPFQIGRHGQLQEWLVDFEEAVPSHRHTSHLMAVYPERQITARDTPELARAAEITIERRESAPGWEQTEWVEANLVAYSARLLDGDRAERHVRNLIADASEANLLSFSAGGVAGAEQNIYSFDGNAGGTAGIAEMLMQSDGTTIELLPALPRTWRSGSVTGLHARNRITLDLRWGNGELVSAVLHAGHDAAVEVRHGSESIRLDLQAGESRRVLIA